jgi:hypothetical protein
VKQPSHKKVGKPIRNSFVVQLDNIPNQKAAKPSKKQKYKKPPQKQKLFLGDFYKTGQMSTGTSSTPSSHSLQMKRKAERCRS